MLRLEEHNVIKVIDKFQFRLNLFVISKWNGIRITRRQDVVFKSWKSVRFGGDNTTNETFLHSSKKYVSCLKQVVIEFQIINTCFNFA